MEPLTIEQLIILVIIAIIVVAVVFIAIKKYRQKSPGMTKEEKAELLGKTFDEGIQTLNKALAVVEVIANAIKDDSKKANDNERSSASWHK